MHLFRQWLEGLGKDAPVQVEADGDGSALTLRLHGASTPPVANLAALLAGSGLAALGLDERLHLGFATPAALAMLGLPAEAEGRPLPDGLADPWLAADAAAVLADGTPRQRKIETAAGPVLLRRAARQAAAQAEWVVVTYADVTERRAHALALHAAQARLHEMSAAHANFIAATGHDLRQPVQVLALLLGLAMRQTTPEAMRRVLGQMEPMIRALTSLIDRLRDSARTPANALAPQFSVFPLGALLEPLAAEFAPLAAARGLELRVIPSAQLIQSDPALLGQILRRLLTHALDEAPGGRILLGGRRRGGRLSVEVHHAGLRRPAALASPGLGLVHGLAAQLGHPVGRPGAPLSVEVTRGAAPQPATVLPAAPRSGTILVIEGDPALRSLLAEILVMEGHHVVAAADGPAALELAPGIAPPPAIILADEALPGPQDGVELCQALRRLWSDELPVLILTEGDGARRAAIAAAGQVQLPKPVKPHSLASLVQSLLPAAAAPAPAPTRARSRSRLIYLVDDDPALCAALGAVLTEAGYAVRDYPSAEAFLASYQRGGDACLLVDARLPGLSGLELLARLREAGDAIPSVMITGFSDLATAVLAMRRGASDFVTKPVRVRVLLEVLERAMAHAKDCGKRSAAQAEAAERLAGLTQRQREILDRVLAGEPSKNIAADLGISRRTVEVHRAAIMRQLKAKSLPALVRLVLTAAGREGAA